MHASQAQKAQLSEYRGNQLSATRPVFGSIVPFVMERQHLVQYLLASRKPDLQLC